MLCRFLFYAVALCQAEEQAEVEAEPIGMLREIWTNEQKLAPLDQLFIKRSPV